MTKCSLIYAYLMSEDFLAEFGSEHNPSPQEAGVGREGAAEGETGRPYRVRCERRGRGWVLWISGPGLGEEYVTQARSYDEVEAVARETLAAVAGTLADDPELMVEVVLPAQLQRPVILARRFRLRAAAAQRQSVAALKEAARMLVAAGYSKRDTAALLGVSRQRISQVLEERGPRGEWG